MPANDRVTRELVGSSVSCNRRCRIAIIVGFPRLRNIGVQRKSPRSWFGRWRDGIDAANRIIRESHVSNALAAARIEPQRSDFRFSHGILKDRAISIAQLGRPPVSVVLRYSLKHV